MIPFAVETNIRGHMMLFSSSFSGQRNKVEWKRTRAYSYAGTLSWVFVFN